MSVENLKYWTKGFSFDRNHVVKNKVTIEVYRILMHYTVVHNNVRVGAYLYKSGFSQFYPLQQIIHNFDLFFEVASGNTNLKDSYYPDYIKDTTGFTLKDQIETVWKLEYPIWLEVESVNLYDQLFGYKFKRPIRVKIEPNDIVSLDGRSLGDFAITIRDYKIEVAFRNNISIK